MRIISHRGNISGANSCVENHPESVENAIRLGFEVEVDIWVSGNSKLLLGHDLPEFEVQLSWLVDLKDSLWLHCKNMQALEYATINLKDFNFFFHQSDDYVLTSKGYVWVFPGRTPPKNSIVVLPESEEGWIQKLLLEKNLHGVCTDYPASILRS